MSSVATISVGGALVGGAIAADGAKDAAETSAGATLAATNQAAAKLNYDANEAISFLNFHVKPGRAATNNLLPFARGSGADQPLTPDEQYLLDESLGDVNRHFAAGGKAFSGQRAKALRDTAANVRTGLNDRRFNRLLNLANLGVTVDTNRANARLGSASQTANLTSQGGIAAGNALAAGQLGQANAYNNAIGGAIDGYLVANYLSANRPPRTTTTPTPTQPNPIPPSLIP